MSGTRRRFFQDAAVLGVGMFGMAPLVKADEKRAVNKLQTERNTPQRRVPMVSPDIPDMPYTMDGGVKVFRLKAEPLKQKIAPFKTIDVWGYNGSCPGPTIQVTQGDRVRVIFENGLPESTSIHWHGLEVPIEQDGVPFISQKPVPPGGTYTYEFTVHQEGTFFYHAHSAMQEMIGLIGMFIAHPEIPYAPHADHDFGIVLQEWAVLPGNSVPNTASMEYNWLTFNGVSAPATTPLIVRLGEPGAITVRKSGNGSSPHSFARASIRDHRNGRRARARDNVVPDEYGAGGRSTGESGGIRSQISGDVDDSLPPASPHDEQHDGPAARPADSDGEFHGRESYATDAITFREPGGGARTPFADIRKCKPSARISAGCVHGNGDG